MIVRASIYDAHKLTEIALKSKYFWYSNELIESWTSDLTVTSKMSANCTVFKCLVNEYIASFYILNPPKEKSITLEMLFVFPEFI